MEKTALKMLPIDQYAGVDIEDPIRFYNYPVIGRIYRQRIELCLAELRPGQRILEVGFGSGVTFLNLNEKYREIHGLDLKADILKVSEVFKKIGLKVFLKNGNILSMPYPDDYFDSVLLISILEHLKPAEQAGAFSEIRRVLKKGGQVVYGVPAETPFMTNAFRILGYDISKYHFSDEKQVFSAAETVLKMIKVSEMKRWPLGKVYETGHFVKE
jgi:ubiquinone/menaquinone biosynthesis C-methylase UbiE